MNVVFAVAGVRRPSVESLARRGVHAALRRGRVPRGVGEMHVVWTSVPRIRALNRRFRGTGRATDVIAFRHPRGGRTADPAPFLLPPGALDSLGELHVCVPQARSNARRFGASVEEELVRLVVHGTLHLLGYTDYRPAPRRRMWSVQEAILRRLFPGRSLAGEAPAADPHDDR
jgi:probable rRNA maturation factor